MPLAAGLFYRCYNREILKSPLVLIHGAGGLSLSWPPQVRRLPGLPVYALDLPGHGETPGPALDNIPSLAEAVADWITALSLPAVVAVGHSLGSAVAMQLGVDHPEKVCGMALLGAGAALPVNPALLQLASQPMTLPQAVDKIVRWSFTPHTPSTLTDIVKKRMLETPPGTLYCDLKACSLFDVHSRLSELGMPVLILCGSEDRMTPSSLSKVLLEGIAGARLGIVERAAHMVMLERVDAVARYLQEFIRGFYIST